LMDLSGKVAVVTGASSGCGQAIAAALEARGMVVAAVSRHSERFATDVSDRAAVDRLKAAVEAELGAPCVVVNAAGIFGPIETIAESDPAEWIETLMINTVGPYLVLPPPSLHQSNGVGGSGISAWPSWPGGVFCLNSDGSPRAPAGLARIRGRHGGKWLGAQ
jgi:hypothetical protein